MRSAVALILILSAPLFVFAADKVQETDLSSTAPPGPDEATPPKWTGQGNFLNNRNKDKDLVDALWSPAKAAPADPEAAAVNR